MSYLSYVSDADLEAVVEFVLNKGFIKLANVNRSFEANVIDPFSTLFEAATSDVGHSDWKQTEVGRQVQKAIVQNIGLLHQKLLGQVNGWRDLGTGGIVDLVCDSRRIIAEVKNKHNTITGGKLVDQYDDLYGLVSPKSSVYHGCTAYFVNIVPKRPVRLNQPFTPSDRKTGSTRPVNQNIRIIDGASFYELVTGRVDAIQEFYSVLPVVIESLIQARPGMQSFQIKDKSAFERYFKTAFGY